MFSLFVFDAFSARNQFTSKRSKEFFCSIFANAFDAFLSISAYLIIVTKVYQKCKFYAVTVIFSHRRLEKLRQKKAPELRWEASHEAA